METINALSLFDEPLARLLFLDSYTWEAISGTAKIPSPTSGKDIYTTHCRLVCNIKTRREPNECELAAMQDIIIYCLRNASPVPGSIARPRLKLLTSNVVSRTIINHYELIYEC